MPDGFGPTFALAGEDQTVAELLTGLVVKANPGDAQGPSDPAQKLVWVADNEAELSKMPNAALQVIRSSWGHMAGLPGANPVDDAFVDTALQALLASD